MWFITRCNWGDALFLWVQSSTRTYSSSFRKCYRNDSSAGFTHRVSVSTVRSASQTCIVILKMSLNFCLSLYASELKCYFKSVLCLICQLYVLFAERQSLNRLQILTSRILMAKMQGQEEAWYVFSNLTHLFIFLPHLSIRTQDHMDPWASLSMHDWLKGNKSSLGWSSSIRGLPQRRNNTFIFYLTMFLSNRQPRKGRRRLETRSEVGEQGRSLVLAGWMAIIMRMGWKTWPCSKWLKWGRVPHRWVHISGDKYVLMCWYFHSRVFFLF